MMELQPEVSLVPSEQAAIEDLMFSIRCAEGLGLLSADAATSFERIGRSDASQKVPRLVEVLGRAIAREVMNALEADMRSWLESGGLAELSK